MMPEHSSMHFYLNWAKERIDEMDATVASLEAKASQLRADSQVKAGQLREDLQRRRDAFQDTVKKHADAGQATWERTQKELEPRWNEFEAHVKTYIETVGKQIEQQQATFRDVAAAQMKAWRKIADSFNEAAAKASAAHRADLELAAKQMKANASEVEARMKKLEQAGKESWQALSEALAESRKAFDRAHQTAWDAFKRTDAAPKA
jgi:hypothetical protein